MKALPKMTKLYAAGLFLLALALLVFAQQAFNLDPLYSPSEPKQILLLVTLSAFVFLVLLIFGFVLLRTLVKVWAERKQQKPGSKFKTTILVSLVTLTLIPATCSFLFAFGLISRSISKWFSVPVGRIFTASGQMGAEWRRDHETLERGILNYLSQNDLNLDKARDTFRLQGIFVLDDNGYIMRFSSVADVAKDSLARKIREGLGKQNEAFLDIDPYWIGVRREPAQPNMIMAVVFSRPDKLEELTARLDEEKQHYQTLVDKQIWIRDTYVLILLLMTVLVLFAAVWIGLFLSKKITIPIEALSVATREISAGNLDYRVDVHAEDELGLLVSLFNDMAAQLQGTTRELEARRRYVEIILESIPTGVVSVDSDLRVTKVNRVARTMFSVESATSLADIFGRPDVDAIRELLQAANTSSVTREIAFNGQGRLAHTAVTATQLTAGGFVLVIEDLTEVVRAQKASAWREVARRLAHEIKNPLTPIQLSAERIARNIARLPAAPPRVTTVIEECVQAIVEEVSSLKNLVDEFVRFARLPTVSRVPKNMKDLVDRTMALYEGRLDSVKVTIDVPVELPLILMDPIQMKRVLVNLLDNALEALSGEPVQELSLRCDLVRDDTMARLTVTDTGRGISAEDRERLFTPYFSTRKNGTGLGLSISSRIIADHGGYIGVEPNTPRGTRFVIELPVCQESSLSMTSPVSGSR
jgi:nitrogen fixation/metabolism regulation signal transduction histidine kinase